MEHKPNIYHSGLHFMLWCSLVFMKQASAPAEALNKDDVCLFTIKVY